MLLLSIFVPPRALKGNVGGFGVPNRRWVTTVGGVTLDVIVPTAIVPADVPHVGAYPPLLLGGGSACVLW